MAKTAKGEVPLEIDGQSYKLRLSINEIVDLENELDKSVNEIADMLSDAAKLRMGTIRSVFRAALKGGGHDLSAEDTGELLAKLGAAEGISALGETFAQSFPEPEGDAESPPATGQGGTGKAS